MLRLQDQLADPESTHGQTQQVLRPRSPLMSSIAARWACGRARAIASAQRVSQYTPTERVAPTVPPDRPQPTSRSPRRGLSTNTMIASARALRQNWRRDRLPRHRGLRLLPLATGLEVSRSEVRAVRQPRVRRLHLDGHADEAVLADPSETGLGDDRPVKRHRLVRPTTDNSAAPQGNRWRAFRPCHPLFGSLLRGTI